MAWGCSLGGGVDGRVHVRLCVQLRPLALVDDGSCERESCAGCTFQLACNYDPMAVLDDGSCTVEGAQDAHGRARRITTRQPRWTTGLV